MVGLSTAFSQLQYPSSSLSEIICEGGGGGGGGVDWHNVKSRTDVSNVCRGAKKKWRIR